MRVLLFLLAFFGCALAQNSVSIDEKIKAMIMVGLGKNADFNELGYAGSVILFARDFNSSTELKALSAKLHARGLKVAIDEEGGKVSRIAKLGFKTQSPKSIADLSQKKGYEVAKKAYEKMANALGEHGVDINFAPVVDLHSDNSPIIGAYERAFSTEPDEVAKMAELFIAEHDKKGIITSLKHFVGHGHADSDTHNDAGRAVADEAALKPYQTLINKGSARSVMVSHLNITNIDQSAPATLSSAVISGLLREKLGFGGVVFSDDMDMKALDSFSLEQKVLGFIAAGGDIMIFARYFDDKVTAKMLFEIIKTALKDGKITQERINKSYERISKLFKEKK